MSNAALLFKRQLTDTFRNKTALIQFLLFPILTLIMQKMVRPEGLPENFFVTLFGTMYVGMAPMTAAAAIIAEEKEKNTLRVLLLAGVRPREYLIGSGGAVFLPCLIGGAVLCAAGEYTPAERVQFLAVLAAGTLVSILLGGAIGVASRSQMSATSLTVPVMLLCSFLPMLGLFNRWAGVLARWLYSGQVNRLLGGIGGQVDPADLLIFGLNLLLAAGLFVTAYRKRGLT